MKLDALACLVFAFGGGSPVLCVYLCVCMCVCACACVYARCSSVPLLAWSLPLVEAVICDASMYMCGYVCVCDAYVFVRVCTKNHALPMKSTYQLTSASYTKQREP